MFFRRRKPVDPPIIAHLKTRPDEWMITPTYMATWSPKLRMLILVPGDYRGLSTEEVNAVIDEHILLALKT